MADTRVREMAAERAGPLAAWGVLLTVCILFCALRAMSMWCAHGLLLLFFAAALAPTAYG